ncbi:hypothetical protein GGI20_001760 [Coemansia sp. BCRC 34301]|nr:hypothetical protein GGI20_001760 [Coemansia sp. BCRC 34301]
MSSELERLLSQIKSECAHDVVAPPTQAVTVFTGVEALDDALSEIYNPSNNSCRSPPPPLFELLGQTASGKTQTLYHICATIAMPRCLAGHEGHVLFVDIDGKASPRILAHHMLHQAPTTTSEATITRALQRVHFFAPSSTQSLIATLALLPKYVRDRDITPAALLIDGLGCNYWADRKEAAHIRLRSKRVTPFFRLQQLLVDTLQMVHQRLACLAVAASLLLLPALDNTPSKPPEQEPYSASSCSEEPSSQPQPLEYRDHMIQRWSSLVTRSFVLDSACVEPSSSSRSALTRVTFTPSSSHRRHQSQPASKPLSYTAYIGPHGLRRTTAN